MRYLLKRKSQDFLSTEASSFNDFVREIYVVSQNNRVEFYQLSQNVNKSKDTIGENEDDQCISRKIVGSRKTEMKKWRDRVQGNGNEPKKET